MLLTTRSNDEGVVPYVIRALQEVMAFHYSFRYLVSDLTQSRLLVAVISSHIVFVMFASLDCKRSRYSPVLSNIGFKSDVYVFSITRHTPGSVYASIKARSLWL